jgi:hypothetical protein
MRNLFPKAFVVMWIAVGALCHGASRAQVVDFGQVNLVSDIRGDDLPQFQLALVGAFNCDFRRVFFAHVSDASALVTVSFPRQVRTLWLCPSRLW